VDTKLSVLPLSMITLHTLSLVLQAVLNKLFLWTGSCTSFSGFTRDFLIMSDLPSSSCFYFHLHLHIPLLCLRNVSFSNSCILIFRTFPRHVPCFPTSITLDFSSSASSSTSWKRSPSSRVSSSRTSSSICLTVRSS
jgi:hypothetical protein